jgi:hypothetical protein
MNKNISNPLIFGPGVWFKIHLDALNLESKEEQLFFIKQLRKIVESLPCGDCRQHATKYVEQNPPEKYLGLVDGLFIFTVEFHNFVNKRLKKPILSLEEAKNLYLNPAICYENCGDKPLVSIAPDSPTVTTSIQPYQKRR